MKPQVNRVCSVLAILAACQCASAIDAPFTSFVERIYVTESSSDVGRDKLLLGALVEVNPIDGTELLDSVFVMLPNVWKFIRGLDEVRNTEIRSVALDEMPLEGLFKIGESHPGKRTNFLGRSCQLQFYRDTIRNEFSMRSHCSSVPAAIAASVGALPTGNDRR